MKIAVCAGPAERQVAAQREHMVNAVVQIGLQLFLDVLLGAADAGEVGDRRAFAVFLDLVENFQILADVGAACAVGAGNVVGVQGVELFQHTAFAAQLFHAGVSLRGEYLKGKCRSFFVDFSNAHNSRLQMKI